MTGLKSWAQGLACGRCHGPLDVYTRPLGTEGHLEACFYCPRCHPYLPRGSYKKLYRTPTLTAEPPIAMFDVLRVVADLKKKVAALTSELDQAQWAALGDDL